MIFLFRGQLLILLANLPVLPIPVSAAQDPLAHRGDLSAADRARVAVITRPAKDFLKAERFEQLPAGAATSTKRADRNAFSQPLPTLSLEDQQRFKLGDALFRKTWVTAPASTRASDGLGPLFNARACQRCHLKDGRGHPPAPGERAESMFLRLSIRPRNEAEAKLLADRRQDVIAEPTYGGQLQNFAIPGHRAEGRMAIAYEEIPIALNGGETVTLRKPAYRIEDLGYGPLSPGTMLSPRVASPMIGLGLLEAIHKDDILARADPEDADGDGISGRPNWVRDDVTQDIVLGRLGWKAGNPNVRQQAAHAFTGDIGISTTLTPFHWGECTPAQTKCRAAPNGVQPSQGSVEAPDIVLDLVVYYSRNLAVPVRRGADRPGVLAGKKLFYETGCTLCHIPKYVTRRDAAQDEHAFQLIWPYTDLLLHDMGEGLADGRPEWAATGREWRTAPLWGIGLTKTVSGHTFFLHDGRARNLLEAILWHGGEARAARDRVVAMTPGERRRLLQFLGSL